MAVFTPATELPESQAITGTYNVSRLAIPCLAALLLASILLSWWSSSLSTVYLPAADVWQHMTLLEGAISGNIAVNELLQKHNGLHFIPIPKLVYALDMHFYQGNGLLTASISGLFTALCCLSFARCIIDLPQIGFREKIALALLVSSWLTCILQWESFVNPANLQWSGLNAGLTLMAAGCTKRPGLLVSGSLLAIGCGTPWWLLLFAMGLMFVSSKQIAVAAGSLALLALVWEVSNALRLNGLPPLPLQLLHLFTPLSADQLALHSSTFFANPAGFYLEWGTNLLAFIARFCMPPLDYWLSTSWVAWLSAIPCLACYQLTKNKQYLQPFVVITNVILLTALAAGCVRAQLPGAYTMRFANAGLLFTSACFIPAYYLHRHNHLAKAAWWVIATLYTLLLAITSLAQAGDTIHTSNQRRLSQVAYALGINDPRATSETPFAPLMALSHREIMEHKVVLETHEKGIYNSREHKVYMARESLPTTEVHCDYHDVITRQRRDDPTGYKITGGATDMGKHAMPSILIRDNTRNIGYGISQVSGKTVAEQITQERRWAGFFHSAPAGKIHVIAYNQRQRCQPASITLPPTE